MSSNNNNKKKKQSNLDSFFKPTTTTRKTGKQTTLKESFFGKKKKRKTHLEKENQMNEEDEQLIDSDEEEEDKKKKQVVVDNSPKKKQKLNDNKQQQVDNNRRKRRPVIDDDDDDDDDGMAIDEEKKTVSSDNDTKKKKKNNNVSLSQFSAGKSKPATADSSVEKSPEKPPPTSSENDKEKEAQKDSKSGGKEEKETPTTKTTAPTTIRSSTSKKSATARKNKSDNKQDKELLPGGIAWHVNKKDGATSLPYGALCAVFEKIEEITGRLAIQEHLTNLFCQVLKGAPHDMEALLYLASNSVAPSYECIELGIGDAILIKAIGEAYGTNPSMIKQKYKGDGDLGTVAKESKGKQRTLVGFGAAPKKLLVTDVLAQFLEIAKTTGSQSQKWKTNHIKKLLVRAQGPEAKYIIRGLQGKLRIGLARSTVLISLAHALAKTAEDEVELTTAVPTEELPPEAQVYANKKTPTSEKLEAAVQIIKKAYSEVPSYKSILDAALRVPLQELSIHCSLTPGIPVEPMLAKPTKSIQEVLKRLEGQNFTCEFKYDGERAQVHMSKGGVTRVFSRNLLNTSEKYPEVPKYVQEAAVSNMVTSFVLDTEVVAFNRETGTLVPFQILSTRKKTEESADSAKVQVIVQAFDIMYLNGTSLLNKPLSERRKLLHEHFQAVPNKFQFATSLDHTENGDTAVLEEFLETAVKSQCEGLMVKTLDNEHASLYEPSKRSLNWLKLKKDYLEGLGDSVDLVPLGAYVGRGKRTGVYGAYLLACYDPDTEEYQSVCKIGTGFSDEDLTKLHDSFQEHVVDTKPSLYNTSDSLECDVWFAATQVWEVKAADLSKSSTHRGALGKTGEGAGRGIGLRFPRFERIRPDKKPHEATTSDQILEMYYAQDSVMHEVGGNENDDDDGI